MPPVILSSSRWARQQFGSVDLGDRRRDRRVIAMAAHLVRNPSASLPAQRSAAGFTFASIRYG
jgi:hypothetical protein